MFGRALPLSAVLIVVAVSTAHAASPDTVLVNIAPEQAAALTAAARTLGHTAVSLNPDAVLSSATPPAVLIWEARGGGGDIDEKRAARLREYVRRGGRLCLTLSRSAGTGPFRLGDMLPATAWKARLPQPENAGDPLTLAEADPDLFGQTKPAGFTVPFFYEIRPVAAAERGQARYERYARPAPYLISDRAMPATQAAGAEFWTRSLLSHEWRIRARGADVPASPLLITGRYGAGRIIVFASSAEQGDSPAARAFWTPTLRWLTGGEEGAVPAASAEPQLPAPTTRVDAANRRLLVQLTNPTDSPRKVHLIGRALSWEQTFVADAEADATLPAKGQATVSLPLPARPDPTDYQALAYRDAYVVRLGVLSSSGADLLAQSRAVADLSPTLSLSVAADPSRRRQPYPFSSAPLPIPNEALGLPLAAYAYRSGDTAHVTVEIANRLHNLAPLASAADETDPANPSAPALNDEACSAEHRPLDGVQAWGYWEGKAGKENIVTFTFPHPVTVAEVTLVGAPDDYRKYLGHNPSGVVVEADGNPVARAEGLDTRFPAESGYVRVTLPAPVRATVIRLRLPALKTTPRLGDVEISGWDAAEERAVSAEKVSGTLTLSLANALTGNEKPLDKRTVSILPNARQSVTLPITLPAGGDVAAGILRLVARFTPAGATATAAPSSVREASAPLLVVAPKRPLTSLTELRADSVRLGFIVTRGFRNLFDIGTGTQEVDAGWGQPDDLIWAYSRGLKQIGRNARTQANRLFVTESDMRHYSTPWRAFGDGEALYDVATPLLVERFKKDPDWAKAKSVILEHSDRWDTGPEMDGVYAWQDFEAFNDYLRAKGQPGLAGKTREELTNEITTKYSNLWNQFHLERYTHDVAGLREAFAQEGKVLTITAQGFPLVPPHYQSEIASVVRGMSDDSSWGMADDDIPYTTGRQMGVLAFAPGLQIATLSQWGYDSNLLNNQIWHSPVGTTEPSRRHQYDRAFRGLLRPDGTFTSQYVYGYNVNAGYAYTMNANDYAEWMRVQEKESLLTPEAPVGAGLVVATGYLDDPSQAVFQAGGSSFSLLEVRQAARALQRLHDAGVSISFSANAATLDKWPASNPPLILVNPQRLTTTEAASVKKLIARGVRVVAFTGGQKVALPGALLLPFDPETLKSADAATWAPKITAFVAQPITFPAGTAGYGFRSAGRTFFVVEDWREGGRRVSLRYKPRTPGATVIHAADVSEHRPLTVRRDGESYLIDVPLRPGDGALIAIEEGK